MTRSRTLSLVALVLVSLVLTLLAAPALAKKKNDPNVDLEFLPQQAVAGDEAMLTRDMMSVGVELRLEDARPGDEPAKIGTRTDDDDRRHTLRAVGEVGPYVAGALEELAQDWGLRVGDGDGLVLAVSLMQFKVTETNQAMGATYEARVRLAAELERGGKELWSGSAAGDASRYGKKFSNDNLNEVLSDALIEAFAGLLDHGGLQSAWPQAD